MQVPVSDTVGCGDSFAAAIVLGYVRHYDIPATLALANAVGAGTNVASAGNVLRLLSDAAEKGGTVNGQHAMGSADHDTLLQGNAAALHVLQRSLESSHKL